MPTIAIVYFSGTGHTHLMAQAIAEGALKVEDTTVNVSDLQSFLSGKDDGVNRLGGFLGVMGQSRMALSYDTALTLTGSQPGGWEPTLGGSASCFLTRGRASGNTFPVLRLGTRLHKPLGFS